MPQGGSLFDGSSARAYSAEIEATADGLKIACDDGTSEVVPIGLLRLLSEDARQVRLIRSDIEGWSLLLDKPIAEDVAAVLPGTERYGRLIDKVGLMPALAVLGVVTITIVALGYLAPHWIAPHVPMSWERNVGGAIVGDFGGLRCRDAKGQKALEALVERVAPGATNGPNGIKVAALNVPIFNAAALPGGYIVVFKPAITETDPDALAGVLAHEIAHVRRRHVTEALIRELGIGAVIRLFAGGVGANAEQIVALSYTRDNEAQADSDAIAMLRRAGISPKPTAELFNRMSKETGEAAGFGAGFLQSHPLSRGRAAKFAASFDPQAHYQPALNGAQWDALFDVCRETPQKK